MLSIFNSAQACISCIFVIGAVTGYVFNSASHSKDARDKDGCKSQVYNYDKSGKIKSIECVKE